MSWERIINNISPYNLYSLYRFIIELIPLGALFAVRLHKREKFGRRLALGLVICFLLSSYWSRELAAVELFASFRYITLFFVASGIIYLSFKCSKLVALACGMGGYAAHQNNKIRTRSSPWETGSDLLFISILLK